MEVGCTLKRRLAAGVSYHPRNHDDIGIGIGIEEGAAMAHELPHPFGACHTSQFRTSRVIRRRGTRNA